MKKTILLAAGLQLALQSYALDSSNTATIDSTGCKVYSLDEITVISNPKSDIRLFEFPGSITYLNTERIDNMNIRSIKDISTVAPNVYLPDYGSKLISSAYVRGIGSRINSPAVGLNVNNIPYLDKSAFDFDFLEVESIEVLRGPQGTLFGRNTMAGLINIHTKSPLDYQGTKIRLGGGNYAAWNAAASTSQKITSDMALAVGARYRRDNGYFTNSHNDKACDQSEVAGGHLQFDWRVSSRFKLSVSANYEWSKQNGYPYARYDKESGKTGAIAYNDESSYLRHLMTSGIIAQYTHDQFIFTSTTGYQYLNDDMRLDQDFTPLSIFTLQQKQREHALSEELVFKSHSDRRWQWVAGVFGSYQNIHTDGPVDFRNDGVRLLIEEQTNNQLAALKNIPALANMPDIRIGIDNRSLYIDGKYETPVYGGAIFGQTTLNRIFIDGLSATVGLRFDYERAEITHRTAPETPLTGTATVTIPNMPMPIQKPFELALGADGKDHMDLWEFSPKIEVKYAIDKDIFSYASVTRGYRSGGYNFQMFSNIIQEQIRIRMMKELMGSMGGGNRAGNPMGDMNLTETDIKKVISYKPEHSWNYELGARAQWLNHRLSADLTVFYIDCRDQQISAVSGYGRVTRNSGRTESFGLEASLRAIPVTNLLLSAGYGFTHATFKDYNDGEKDYRGNFVPFAPAHTLSVNAAYKLPIDAESHLTFDIQFLGRGKIYWTEANDVAQNFYGLLNAGIAYESRWGDVRLWGKNLTATRYQAFYFETMNAENLSSPNSFVQKGRPFTFGIDLTLKF